MVVNQNCEPGSYLAAGDGRVIARGGLLEVVVGPGDNRSMLVYPGMPLEAGLLVPALTIPVATSAMLTKSWWEAKCRSRQ
jgi:hypothetical protein